MVGTIITSDGDILIQNRAFKATPDYTIPSKFGVGIEQATPVISDTELTYIIPIDDGTVNDDGSNTLTGSSGGDNSTDNTTRYKPIPGITTADLTAQNLIANDTATTKIWTLSNLATAGTNMIAGQPFGNWIYIKDTTALDKIVSIEMKFGSDSSNYYSLTTLNASLSTGWNWITSNTINLEDLDETGTVTGNIDTFIIEIVTNNATDTFVAGDVIYDLTRQWDESDTVKDMMSSYPSISETAYETEMRGFLTSIEANGFDIDGLKYINTDASPKTFLISKSNSISKSSTDEIEYQTVLRRKL